MGYEMDLPELMRLDLSILRKVAAAFKEEIPRVDPTQSEKSCCVHPLMSGKRLNGRKALRLSRRFSAGVVGKTPREDDDPLNYRYRPADRAELRVRCGVRPNDIAAWGERAINHRRVTKNFRQYRIIVRAEADRERPAEWADREP